MIESLETRIAPASFVTYTDIDGDLVKITASKGTMSDANLTLSGGTSGALVKLDVSDAAFSGADIVFSVVKKSGGDGLATVELTPQRSLGPQDSWSLVDVRH